MGSVSLNGQTLRARRRRFFAASGFAPDGGYDDAWALETFAGVPYAVPNLASRARALRVHDLHHVLTGYGADWRGESEISGWELGSGGGGPYVYAWFVALFGLLVGLLSAPSRTWAAFRRGRGSKNLFADPDPPRFLEVEIERAQAVLGVVDEARPLQPRDVLLFGAYSSAALIVGTIGLALSPLLVLLAAARCPCLGCPTRQASP